MNHEPYSDEKIISINLRNFIKKTIFTTLIQLRKFADLEVSKKMVSIPKTQFLWKQ